MTRMARRFHRGWRAMTSPRTTWGRSALLAVAAALTVFVPTLSYVAAASDGHGLRGSWDRYASAPLAAGYVATDLGCIDRLSASQLGERFAGNIGPIAALDNAHVIGLGRNRFLWFFNDTFVDYSGRATNLLGMRFLPNIAILQEGRCFTLIRQGTTEDARSFMLSKVINRFFWPLGGEAVGGRLQVFWAEMLSTRDEPHQPSDGLTRHPVRTWLGTYDPATLERLSFRPAPNDGVFPQYGFAVASDDRFSYLFGNSNLLDYSREGGYYARSHSATKMYLARVPRGRLDQEPKYRTAGGWSDDPDDAVPISDRFFSENAMQPRYLDGHWISVTKVDGFSGTDTIVEVARNPWGPWRVVSKRTVSPVRGFDKMTTYQPIVLPYREKSGRMIIVASQNAQNWPEAIDDFSMYRPLVYAEPWPFDD